MQIRLIVPTLERRGAAIYSEVLHAVHIQKKSPTRRRASIEAAYASLDRKAAQEAGARAFTRCANRETFREAVFL
jgi:hypothetical protein